VTSLLRDERLDPSHRLVVPGTLGARDLTVGFRTVES
jgi:hypothetical protein